MKRIGIDGRLISQTGVGVYIRNLLYYFSRHVPKDWQIYLYLMNKDFEDLHLPYLNFCVKRRAPFRWHSFSEQLGFARLLYQDNLDLVHFTYFTYPWLYRKRFIATVHDLTPLFFKTGKASTKNKFVFELKHFIFRQVLRSEVNRAIKIITPSKTVKKQIISVFGEQLQRKIVPLPEGIDYQLAGLRGDNRLKRIFKKPFFIYVGNFYPHKNVSRLIKAFSKLNQDVSLVLVGPDDFFARRLRRSNRKLWEEKKLFFYPNASKSDLVFFYKNSLALIHPSLSEGFGLTILEALYFNCPVLAADIDVFNELYDGFFLKFNPYDVGSIRMTMEEFLRKRPFVKVSKVLLNKFSFEKMADKTLALYKEVLFS